MDDDLRTRADARLEQALAAAPFQDSRTRYREQLRDLRQREPDAFTRAVRRYEETVLPRLASDETDAFAEWLEYGRFLADLDGPGRWVEIEVDGRARSWTGELRPGRAVLFLPEDRVRPARVLVLPREPSPPQATTAELLTGATVA